VEHPASEKSRIHGRFFGFYQLSSAENHSSIPLQSPGVHSDPPGAAAARRNGAETMLTPPPGMSSRAGLTLADPRKTALSLRYQQRAASAVLEQRRPGVLPSLLPLPWPLRPTNRCATVFSPPPPPPPLRDLVDFLFVSPAPSSPPPVVFRFDGALVMASAVRHPTVPERVSPSSNAARHCCKSACLKGGSVFSVVLILRRGSSTLLIVYASGLTKSADNGTRKALKAAEMFFFRSLPAARQPQPVVPHDPSTGLMWGGPSAAWGWVRNATSSAGSTLHQTGHPPSCAHSTACDVGQTGGGPGGGGERHDEYGSLGWSADASGQDGGGLAGHLVHFGGTDGAPAVPSGTTPL